MNSKEPRYLGHYLLQECLAYGGMGEVWKALDTRLDRTVAIKLLRSEWRHSADFVARFKSEAQLIASLHHPNIVKIHNFYVSEEAEAPLMYMVMDYVQGQTLADYIRKTSGAGQFPSAADVVYIFTAVGLALDYAHARDMIHRDIKPANILLDQRFSNAHAMGEPILTDFGIARRQGVSGGTIVGSIVGTPLYVSPEQAQGIYDEKRSDLYSLGVILYEMVTGVTPFRNAAPMALLVQHIYEQPTLPELINPRISPELSTVILKSIEKRPEDRFSTGSEFALALAEALHVPPPEVLRGASRTLQNRSASSHPLLPSNGYNAAPALSAGSQRLQQSSSPLSLSGVTALPTRPALPGNREAAPVNPAAPTSPVVPPAVPAHVSDPAAPTLISTRGRAPSIFKSRWLLALVALLIVVVIGVSVVSLLPPSPGQANAIVGQAKFSASGPTAKPYDSLQIDIQNAAPLPAGKVYMAWIDQVSNESNHPHWQLQLDHGSIHMSQLRYPNFNNLLIPNSLFLVTIQDDGTSPIVPSASPADRLYYARIGKQPAPTLDLQRCPSDPSSTTCF